MVVAAGGARFSSPSLSLALSAPVPLLANSTGAYADFTLAKGESRTFVLEEADAPSPLGEQQAQAALEATVTYWLDWLAQSTYTGRWREFVNRSALSLKLLTFAPTGAIVAAATTSLPEQLGGGRNWDYRYTWIRDAAFSLYALLRLGFTQEAEAFGAFIGMCARRHRRFARGPAAADVRDRRPHGPSRARALAPRGLHGLLPRARSETAPPASSSSTSTASCSTPPT